MKKSWLILLVVGMVALTGCGMSQVQNELESTPAEGPPSATQLNLGMPNPEIAVAILPGFRGNGCLGLVPCEIHVKVNEVVDIVFTYVVPNFCFPTYGAPMCKPGLDIDLPSDGLRVGHGGMRAGHYMITPQFSAETAGEHFIRVDYELTQNRWVKADYSGSTVLKVIATE